MEGEPGAKCHRGELDERAGQASLLDGEVTEQEADGGGAGEHLQAGRPRWRDALDAGDRDVDHDDEQHDGKDAVIRQQAKPGLRRYNRLLLLRLRDSRRGLHTLPAPFSAGALLRPEALGVPLFENMHERVAPLDGNDRHTAGDQGVYDTRVAS